jgi:hypothetical protein
MQKECHSHCRDEAPMIDANRKKYESNRFNNMEDNSNWDGEPKNKDVQVGSVATHSVI